MISFSLHSLKARARLAGLFYLLHILAAVYGVIIVSSKIGISGTAEMAGQLLSHEFLFRTGIFFRLVSSVPWIIMAFLLYRIFQHVHPVLSKLLLAWLALPLSIQFIAEAFNITSLAVAKGQLLQALDPVQRKDFTLLLLNVYNAVVSLSELFWGLWLVPFGLLIYRSRFLPPVLGIALLLSGIGYTCDFAVYVLLPQYKNTTTLFLAFGSLCEIGTMLWLLIKGMSTAAGTFFPGSSSLAENQ